MINHCELKVSTKIAKTKTVIKLPRIIYFFLSDIQHKLTSDRQTSRSTV